MLFSEFPVWVRAFSLFFVIWMICGLVAMQLAIQWWGKEYELKWFSRHGLWVITFCLLLGPLMLAGIIKHKRENHDC